MSELKFGTKTRCEKLSFLISDKLHTAIFPKIEVNGKLTLIRDENSPVRVKEFPDTIEGRKEARKYAKQTLLRLRKGNKQFKEG